MSRYWKYSRTSKLYSCEYMYFFTTKHNQQDASIEQLSSVAFPKMITACCPLISFCVYSLQAQRKAEWGRRRAGAMNYGSYEEGVAPLQSVLSTLNHHSNHDKKSLSTRSHLKCTFHQSRSSLKWRVLACLTVNQSQNTLSSPSLALFLPELCIKTLRALMTRPLQCFSMLEPF